MITNIYKGWLARFSTMENKMKDWRGTEQINEFMRGIVRGYIWRCKMKNNVVFEIWTPSNLIRKDAKKLLLDFANGDYGEVYGANDIKNIWSCLK